MKRILLKSILSLLGLVLIGPVMAQLTVDQVNNDSLALTFVKQQNYSKNEAPQWKFFYLTTGQEWKSYFNFSAAQTSQLTSEMHSMNWQKADINGDHKMDLIVSGYIARRPGDWSTATFKLLVFLSQSGKGYQELNLLTENAEKFPAYFDLIRLQQKDFIRLFRWQLPEQGQTQQQAQQQPYQIDTVSYSNFWSAFINQHEAGLNRKQIQMIVYKAQEDAGGAYHALTIFNSSEKKTNIEISTWQPKEKTPSNYKARLSKTLWEQLDTLSRSIQVAQVPGGDSVILNHRFNSQDLPVTLTLHFQDGSTQKIVDYGAQGSFTLMTVYGCMENIIQNVFDQMQQRQQIIQSLSDGVFGD